MFGGSARKRSRPDISKELAARQALKAKDLVGVPVAIASSQNQSSIGKKGGV